MGGIRLELAVEMCSDQLATSRLETGHRNLAPAAGRDQEARVQSFEEETGYGSHVRTRRHRVRGRSLCETCCETSNRCVWVVRDVVQVKSWRYTQIRICYLTSKVMLQVICVECGIG